MTNRADSQEALSDFYECPICHKDDYAHPASGRMAGEVKCSCGYKGKLQRLTIFNVLMRLNRDLPEGRN